MEFPISLSKTPIRVLIAQSSDRPIARAALARLLETCAHIEVVGEATDKDDALRLIPDLSPEIILLDTFECDEAALDFLGDLSEANIEGRTIVLTGCGTATVQSQAVTCGALGIVRYDQSPEILFKAIQSVHGGEIWLERSLAASVLQEKTRASNRTVSNGQTRIANLNEREHEVIALVCEGLKNQAIAERLFISEATVRHRLTSIFEKLAISDRLELVIFAFQHGLATLPRAAEVR